jgi:uncharacterized protein YodC (DUF2158 family)
MSYPFSIGDVVRLKSGGPAMTVESINENDKRVTCVWYCDHAAGPGVDHNGVKRGAFSPSVLSNSQADPYGSWSRLPLAPTTGD